MKVVTFGELMLRLAPNGYYRFFQNDQMQATFGGGEANVAVSLANYGFESTYVTKLPRHAIILTSIAIEFMIDALYNMNDEIIILKILIKEKKKWDFILALFRQLSLKT